MINRNDSIVYLKSFKFAVRVVELYKLLCEEKKEYVLSKQLLRSGTSIGANIREALEGQSKKDFIAKLSISLKEATETEYWLELMYETNYLDQKRFESLLNDLKEIIKLLNSIIKTSKRNVLNADKSEIINSK
jgi:four helix bundle protein